VNDFSNSIKTVWEWWDKWPEANIGIDLGKSGLVDIAPDSPEWHEIFRNRGLPHTALFQSGGEGHRHYLYRRLQDIPLININKADQYDIQPRGYAVAPGSLHQSGRTYQWITDYQWRDVEDLPFAPEWALNEIQERWESYTAVPEIDVDLRTVQLRPELLRGTLQEWWHGERAATHDDGTTDRSLTLFMIGLRLARQGASPKEIVSALRDRDEALGFYKYSRRKGGGIKEYTAIAQAAMASRERRDRTHPDANVPFTVEGISIYIKKDSKRKGDNTRPSALWDFACRTFPDPPGVKPRVKSHILYSDKEKRALVCDLRSNTWQNPANAAYRKRKTYYHLTRKLSMFEGLWHTSVAADDWNENSHDA
jgi:hypothetical protein